MDPYRGMKDSSDGLGRQLHRSVSMITQPLAQHLRSSQESDGSISGVSQRRRTSSADEQGIDGGLALLRSPSKALQDTVKLMSTFPGQSMTQSTLPVLDFVARRHDLDALRTSMELALRKAACRVFAMEVDKITTISHSKYYISFILSYYIEPVLATAKCHSARVFARLALVVGVVTCPVLNIRNR